MEDFTQLRVETFQRSFTRKPGKFCTPVNNHAKAAEVVEMMVSQVEYDVSGIELQTISWD